MLLGPCTFCERARGRLRTTADCRAKEAGPQAPECRARPAYPAELFDDLIELAELEPGARLLEIRCATGKATLPLAKRGFVVVCVEIGAHLAERARARLAGSRRCT